MEKGKLTLVLCGVKANEDGFYQGLFAKDATTQPAGAGINNPLNT